ncbi:MAG: ABC transporter ATP-binding protein [Planctomycetes bacterium]|nr:ABC transporter ATP-binding protein [Planctomycetota bacterium]
MKELYRIYSTFFRPFWLKVALIVLLAAVSSLAPFLFGYLGRTMVDRVLQIQVAGAAAAAASSSSPKPFEERLRLLYILTAVLVGCRLLLAGTQALYTYQMRTLAFDVIYRIRHLMHDKLQRLQVAYFDRNLTGKIMARMLDDVGTMNHSVSTVFVPAITALATLGIGIGILFWIDAGLAVLALATLPFTIMAYQLFIPRIRRIQEHVREKNSRLYGLVGDALNGIRVVKCFVQEPEERARFLRLMVERLRLLRRYVTLDATLAALSGLAGSVGLALILYLGPLRVQSGALSVGDLLYFYSAAGLLYPPMAVLLELNVQVQVVVVSARKVFEILDHEVTIRDRPDAKDLHPSTGWVVFAGVWFRYFGGNRDALRNVTFEVPPCSRIALVGATGSGKSTIAHLLVRFYDPTAGSILLDMNDVRDLKLSSLRRHIRIVAQEPILFSGTLADIIRYGQPEATDEDVERAARTAQIHDYIQSLPEGYRSEVGEKGVTLSGGQRQRLAFAMALVTNPTVLILDDSMSALDAETAAQLEDAMESMMRGRTVFIITHRLSTAMRADEILVLHRGRLVEQGDHAYLMAKGGHYARLFSAQAQAMGVAPVPGAAS